MAETKANTGKGGFFNAQELREKAKKHAKKFYTEYAGNIDAVISAVKDFQHIKDNLEEDVTAKMKLEMKIFDAAACVDIAQFSEDDKKKFIAETGVDLSKNFADGGELTDEDNEEYLYFMYRDADNYKFYFALPYSEVIESLKGKPEGTQIEQHLNGIETTYEKLGYKKAQFFNDAIERKFNKNVDNNIVTVIGFGKFEDKPSNYEAGGKVCKTGLRIAMLLFDKEHFTKAKVKSWLKRNDFKYGNIEEEKNHYRASQEPSGNFTEDSFRTTNLKGRLPKGIQATTACPAKKEDGGSVMEFTDLSFVVPSKIEIEETQAMGNPDKLRLLYNGKRIAQFYYNMRGYNQDFSLKNKEDVGYGFGGDRSKTEQVREFKKALKDGFVFIRPYYAEGGELAGAIKELAEPNTLIDTTAKVEMAGGGAVAEDVSENIRIATMHCLESGLTNAVKRSGDITVEMATEGDALLRLDFYTHDSSDKKHKFAMYLDDETAKVKKLTGYEVDKYKALIDQTEGVLKAMGINIENKFETGGDVFSDEIIFTTDDNIAAHKDGWAVSYAGAKDGVPHYELIKVGDKFLSFAGVVKHVVEKAKEGSKLHEKALAFIKAKDQIEWNLIVELSDKDKEFLDSLSAEKFACGGKMAEGGKVERKYKLGDMWSRDFDYDGMLKKGVELGSETELIDHPNINAVLGRLESLFDSFEDVNYHTEGKPLWTAIKLLRDAHSGKANANQKEFLLNEAKTKLKEFVAGCKATLGEADAFEAGGKIKGNGVYGKDWVWEFGVPRQLKRGEVMSQTASGAPIIINPKKEAEREELMKRMGYHESGGKVKDKTKPWFFGSTLNEKFYQAMQIDADKDKQWAEEKVKEVGREWKEASEMSREMLNEYLDKSVEELAREKYNYLRYRAFATDNRGEPIDPAAKERWERITGETIIPYAIGGEVNYERGGKLKAGEYFLDIQVPARGSRPYKETGFKTIEEAEKFVVDNLKNGEAGFICKVTGGSMWEMLGGFSKGVVTMESGGTVNWFAGESFGKDPRLESFDKFNLDDYQYQVYSDMVSKGRTHGEALQLLINQVEGDYSQLGKLAKIAKAQDKEAKVAAKVEQKERHENAGEYKEYETEFGGTIKGYICTWQKAGGKWEGMPVVYGVQNNDDMLNGSFLVVGGILDTDGELINVSEAHDDWFGNESDALKVAKELATNENAFTDQYAAGGKLEKFLKEEYVIYDDKICPVVKRNGKVGVLWQPTNPDYRPDFIVPDWDKEVKTIRDDSKIEYIKYLDKHNITGEKRKKALASARGGYYDYTIHKGWVWNKKHAEGGKVESPNAYDYMLLGRLQSDCDYFLGHGDRSERHLWAGNVHDQIEKMKSLWNGLPEKPEWLSMEDILDYERKMKNDITEEEYHKYLAEGGKIKELIVTKISDIPNLQEKVDAGKVTYRGLGIGKLSDRFWKVSGGQTGFRIKVDGKEYYITNDDLNKLNGGERKIKFDAPFRRGYAEGGEVEYGFTITATRTKDSISNSDKRTVNATNEAAAIDKYRNFMLNKLHYDEVVIHTVEKANGSDKIMGYAEGGDVSFIDILNNPEGKRLVEQIEDTKASLDFHNGKDPELKRILDMLHKRMKDEFGFTMPKYTMPKHAEGGDISVYGTDAEIEEMYLDYVNNFLTVDAFAEHYNISKEKAERIIELGREINGRLESGGVAEIEEMYLDYVNNFLTVDAFAEHYNISKEKADRIIELGREINGRLENGGAVAATWADRTTEVKKYVGPSDIVNKWEYVITWDNYAHRSEELYTSKAKAEAELAERITYLEGLHNMPKGEFAAQFKTNVPKELLDEFVNRRDPKFSNYDNEKYSNFSVDDFKSLVWDQSNANGSIVPGDKLLNFIFPRNFNINSLKNGSGGCNHNEEFMKWESINSALYDIWIEIIGSKNIKEDGGDILSKGGSSSFDKTDFTNVVRDNYSKTDQWHPGDFAHRGNTIFAAGGKAAAFSSTDDLVDVVDILDEWETYCKRKGEDDDDFDEFNAWIDIKYPHPGGKIKNKAVKEFTRTHKEPVYAEGGVASTDWKRLFANPQRFMRYDGQFLYPPRIEHKLQPASLDKLDTGEYIAEVKFNGSSTSVSISENNAVAKERHNTFFAIPPKFDFKSLHRGEGYMCLTGEFMNKSKKDHTGQPFRGFVIWDILAYDGLMLIGSTPVERMALLNELYPSMGEIGAFKIDYLSKTGVPDIYLAKVFTKSFSDIYKALSTVDLIEGICLKRMNAKYEIGSRELNNTSMGVKVRKPTANYIS